MHKFTINVEGHTAELSGIQNNQIHFIFGRNGTGKSRLLRSLDQHLFDSNEFVSTYITPERGGNLDFWGSAGGYIENPDGLKAQLRVNEKNDFRQIAYFHFDELRNIIRKKYEDTDGAGPKFAVTLARINSVLEQIELEEKDKSGFKVVLKAAGGDDIKRFVSSGEKELIGLLIEIALFFETLDSERCNAIILDEPDVHLHPDAQRYVFHFIQSFLDALGSEDDHPDVFVLVATHSTDLLSGLDSEQFKVAYLQHYVPEFIQFEETPAKSGFLLSFGSHPLVMSIDSRPVMIVEGEDDKRIWDDVIRRLQGSLNLWVVASGNKQKALDDSKLLNLLLGSLSESAHGCLLVDRDDDIYGSITDLDRVIRSHTQCNEIENLLLSEEVLQTRTDATVNETLAELGIADVERMDTNLKGKEQTVSNLLGWPHTWESLVSKVIAENASQAADLLHHQNSVFYFLGEEFTNKIFLAQTV